jgi:hypothetical protein
MKVAYTIVVGGEGRTTVDPTVYSQEDAERYANKANELEQSARGPVRPSHSLDGARTTYFVVPDDYVPGQ